jgi:hypothetical protein
MRPVQNLNPPNPNDPQQKINAWIIMMIGRICDASQEDSGTYADPYTVINTTPLRALDAQTATTEQVAEVLATFLDDTKRRGMNRRAG